MKAGLFLMPSHPPERDVARGARWDLDVIRRADELGYAEAWIGEHFTVPWEPCPAPDLLIAQALLETRQIRLAPGAHLLPYHHPVELAHRVAYLDHLSGGRLMLGIGAGGVPSDWAIFGVDGASGENRAMMWEALDLMQRIWSSDEFFAHRSDHWHVDEPLEGSARLNRLHLKPLQKPHPPIGIAGLSPDSSTLFECGARGHLPLSLNLNAPYLAAHWERFSEGARAAGRIPRREDWRVCRDVFVAETDAEAFHWAVEGPMARHTSEYFLPSLRGNRFLRYLKHDEGLSDEEVTPAYLAQTCWLVGSVDTVAAKLEALMETLGGFGTLLQLVYDHADDPSPWMRSMELLATEVLPRVSKGGVAAPG